MISNKDLSIRGKRGIVYAALASTVRFFVSNDVGVDAIQYPALAFATPSIGLILFMRTGIASPFTEPAIAGLISSFVGKYIMKTSWPYAGWLGLLSAAAYVGSTRLIGANMEQQMEL